MISKLFDRLFGIPFEFPPLVIPDEPRTSQIGILTPTDDRMTEIFKEAVAEAVRQHHAAGRSVPTLEGGKVVLVPPQQPAEPVARYSPRDACEACWEAGANPGWMYDVHTCGKRTLRRPQRGDQIGPFPGLYED